MNIFTVGVVVRVSRLGRICCYRRQCALVGITNCSYRQVILIYSHRSYYVVVEWIIMSFSVDSCEFAQSVVLKSLKEGRAALPCSTLQVGSHSSYEKG